MMEVFKKLGGKVQKIEKPQKGDFIRLIDPTPEEIDMVINLTDVDEDFILDPLDEEERARVEIDEDYILIILKPPIKMPQDSHVPYKTSSVGVIITPEHTIVVSKKRFAFIDDNILNSRIDIKKRSKMIFQILHLNANEYLKTLKEIHMRIDEIEEELNRSLRNKEIVELMKLEKGLVYFVTALRYNEIVLERLMKGNIIPLYEEDRDILEDAIVDNRQAIDTANIYSGILAGMMDAYASIISNNLNIVMKVLAVVTIVMEIPTVISSFYGMNVKLPLQNSPLAASYVIIWSVISVILVLYWFKKKKWI
ncbi:MAG: magnesium transporter CorA family protein [Thermotogaceae bacterium]|nr:magnesium transporter CorA family protein [Thermotogaceae bacterium]